MKKVVLIAAILLISAFLPSLASPTLARLPTLVSGKDVVNDNSSQNPEPDFADPNYWDWAFYNLDGPTGGYTGVAAYVYPHAIHFETDWWTDIEEYWVQISVHWAGHYYAEVGLDVVYWPIYGGIWHTQAYAAYSEDPNGYGAVLAWYDLGFSSDGPATAQIATYLTSGTNWAWYVNGVVFATHQFPETFQGYEVHSVTEAYNQPVQGTSGQWISLTDGIYIKRADNGYWSPALYDSGGVTSGWMVDTYAGNMYRFDISARQ